MYATCHINVKHKQVQKIALVDCTASLGLPGFAALATCWWRMPVKYERQPVLH